MPLVPKLIARLQRHPKRIVFPEGADPRILQAARQWVTRRMGAPILLGERKVIKDAAARLSLDITGMRIIEPARSADFETFAAQLEQIRSAKVLKLGDTRDTLLDPNYFATMMLAAGQADALVGGATVTASSALRPLFQLIPRLENVQSASSLMILDWDEKKVGSDGSLFLADCGVIPEPTAEQLCDIAISTAMIARQLTDEIPRVAKAEAARLPMEIEGEIQLDAALDAAVAAMKKIAGPVAGRANVLVFPDLNSGNIGFKLVQILAGANAFGQIITGLTRPAAEISRGASAHDVFGAAAIVGCQAIDRRLLYGTP
jgi:phosphotransacetylase